MACLGLAIDGPGGMELVFVNHDRSNGGHDDGLCFPKKDPERERDVELFERVVICDYGPLALGTNARYKLISNTGCQIRLG